MRIGIDCRSISIGGGVKTYLINLLKNLGKIDSKNEYFIYYCNKKEFGRFKFKNFKEIVIPINSKIKIPFYEQILLKRQAIKDKLDILHSPKNTCPIFLPKQIKCILTFLDITPYLSLNEMSLFDLIYWRTIIPFSIKRANKIISISKATQMDLFTNFPKSQDKCKTVYLGTKDNFKKEINKPKDYFLFVGAIRKRKNVERILEALKIIESQKLYIVGKDLNYLKNIKKIITKLNLDNQVIIKGQVDNKELTTLYKKAQAYLYPSLYEGFGLPILEAQACGCPVITSNISSMPEIAGKGALLVNPYKIEEIAEAMKKIIEDKKLRENLINEGYKNLKRFSWKKCAKETLNMYEEVYNGK